MVLIFALQLVVPLLFVGWIGFVPTRSILGFCIQVVGVAVALLAVGLIGLWLLPPWWTPWVFGGLLLAAVVAGWWRRSPFISKFPSGWMAWLSTGVFTTVGGWGSYQAMIAIDGRLPQQGPVVDLAFPLKGGEFLIVNGGSSIVLNAHLMTLDTSAKRFQAYRGQSYGIDIVKINSWGLRADGVLPPRPSAYFIYGSRVYAPCTGEVIAAFDGVQDMQIPRMDREHMAGNYVMLRCEQADVLLGHLQSGSVSVTFHQPVSVGQIIAKVGNSGNTGEPHLHIHAQRAGTASAPLSGAPLPSRFGGRFLLRNDRISSP